MIHPYLQLPKNAGTTVFTTRLALSIIDAGDNDQDFVTSVGEQLTRATLDAEDGYAARDALEHPLSAQMDETRRSALATVLETSGLDRPLDNTGHRLLTSAARVAASTITGRQPSAMRALISVREASHGQRPPERTAAEGHRR
ncbi:hypothetical protein [Micromonospora sp. WMMD1082]|uniref:hypothetical protein n=1 Tax=Micromonospora sp. WMMD1082 TaxID=3016104 RepID=UPI0024165D1B|nr:hypothetical protein [Micromonospora sp. WMMD1082]MDG4793009.1 hypothetical protein [Micromonospora sp. WMMD1082]